MAWNFLDRLRQWKPLTRNLIVGLIKIATGAAANALPDSELLIKCVGGAAEATAEQCFDALDARQKQAVNDRLLPLLDQHAAFLAQLERGIANQNATVAEVTGLVRAMLKQQPDLMAEYKRFGGGLVKIAQALQRIEEQLKDIHADLGQGFRDVLRRFDEMDRKPKSPYWISIHDEQDVVWLTAAVSGEPDLAGGKAPALQPERFAALLIEANQAEQASAVCQDAVALCPESAEQAGLLLRKMRADLEQQRFDDALAALGERSISTAVGRPFPPGSSSPCRSWAWAGPAWRCAAATATAPRSWSNACIWTASTVSRKSCSGKSRSCTNWPTSSAMPSCGSNMAASPTR